MSFFFKKKKAWREDDGVFLNKLKEPSVPEPPVKKQEAPLKKPAQPLNRPLSVKERLERMQADEKSQVRQRLEMMGHESVPRPLDLAPERKEPAIKKEVVSPDDAVVNKLDKAVKKLDTLRGKMLKADSYLSFFYELKIAEKEFLEAFNEVQTKDVDLPPMMQQHAEHLKANLRINKQK